MSLLNKASLIQIPSGYKDGTLYSAKPTNGDGDFTFSRGSNLAATRVNSEGLIEKGRENLLLQSNSFNTTWINTNVSVTSGQSGYDGSSDAWQVDISASFAQVEQSISSSGVQTFSVYAKAGSLNWVRLRVDHSTFSGTYFDLQNGLVGTTASDINSTIEDVGSGWYRCTLTYNNNITKVRIYPAQADNDLTATSGNIYIQDAQLEVGLVATDYIETTTTTAQAGILEDMPRLDYSGGASCPSLLLEPQRSNLVGQSEVFNIDSSWFLSGRPVVETNAVISPEGVLNGSRLTFAPTHTLRYASQLTFTNGYSYSIFVKKDIGRYVTIAALFFTTSATIGFDLDEGTCEAGGVIEPYGGGWYRISVSKSVAGDADKSGFFYLYSTDTLGGTSSASGNQLYVYGAQIEEGTYPTSYIPTYGASVTRGDENSIITSATDIIGQTEGTMFYEFNSGKNDGADYAISLSDGSANNRIIIYRSSANQLIAQIRTGATSVAQINTSTLTEDITYKVALGYANNDVVFYVNGSLIGSDTSASIPSTDRISTDNSVGSATFGRPLNQLLLFKTRLSNDELASLTTI